MHESLPADAPDVTPAWLSAALARRFPGVEVAHVEVLHRTSATNLHLRLGVEYAAGEWPGAPASLFVKLPPLDPAHREAIGATGMGAREAGFYAGVAPGLGLRVPDAYAALHGADGSFVLLLEDLAARGCTISDGSWAMPAAAAGRALEELAALHVRFEDPAERARHAPWASAPRPDGTEFTTRMLRHVLDERGPILTPEYAAVGELYIEHHAALQALWDRGPHTLTHGDPHVGNLFLDGERVGFLDWGMSTVGSPLRDVSYLLTVGVDTGADAGRRRATQAALLQRYLDARAALGGLPITFDEAWEAHRVLAAYTVIATFLGLVPPYDTEEGRPFATAFRRRSETALTDLATVEAVRTALG